MSEMSRLYCLHFASPPPPSSSPLPSFNGVFVPLSVCDSELTLAPAVAPAVPFGHLLFAHSGTVSGNGSIFAFQSSVFSFGVEEKGGMGGEVRAAAVCKKSD